MTRQEQALSIEMLNRLLKVAFSLINLVVRRETQSNCPIVFNVMEELKEKLEFSDEDFGEDWW